MTGARSLMLASLLLAGLGCGGGGGSTDHAAATPIYHWSAGKGGNLITPSFAAVEGNLFEVTGGKDIVVTHLGYEVTGASQVNGTTAIFDVSGNLLASAVIADTDPQMDGYRYKAISPLTLMSGQQYYIGSLHSAGVDGRYFHNTNVATTPAYILDMGTAAKISDTIEGGTWSPPGSVRHYVGNFQAYSTL